MIQKLVFLRQNPNAIGGAEKYLSRLIIALEKENIHCQIKSLKSFSFLPSWLKAIIFNFQACKNKKNAFYFSLERITCADIYRAGDGVHKVFMATKKNTFNPLHFVYCYLEKRTFQNSKHIIANSNFIKKQIIEIYKIPENKISVIYNGINLAKDFNKQEAKDAFCQAFHIEKNTKLILFVGSGFERKGVEDLLIILSKIKSKFLTLIVGKDKRMNFYKKMANNLNLNEKVMFFGQRKDVDIFYKASDIFLFLPKYEPFSNVILEAMNYKNVVFTTKQNGGSEILEDEFIFENSKDLSKIPKIENLLTNNEALSNQQEKNYIKSREFSIEKNANLTLKTIYENIH